MFPSTSSRPSSSSGVPVFLDRDADCVTAIAVHCDGTVLPIDHIVTLHCHSSKRHGLIWIAFPVGGLIAMGWFGAAAALGLVALVAWWRAPRVHCLDLKLRDGQSHALLRTVDSLRLAELHAALAKALAYRRVQAVSERLRETQATVPPAGAAHEPAWRNTTFDEVRDSGPGTLPPSAPGDVDIRL